MNIYGKKVILRAIEPSDTEILWTMINDPSIEESVIGWSFPVSKAGQAKWYESGLNDKANVRMMIETTDLDDNQVIGTIMITDFDWKNRVVSIGIKLLSTAPRRKGYGTDAIMTIYGYIFDELQMHRIQFGILSNNEASRRLNEKCGAKQEGIQRERVYKKGRHWDVVMYGVLREDYEQARRAMYGE